jgi:hypothetical protein
MELVIEGDFLLERFPGKGGWTYFQVPVNFFPSGKAFGMVKLNGSIDEYEFEGKHLMPMKKGVLFFPVSKPIRLIIGKEEGDIVHVKLYREGIPSSIPQELIDCLNDDPGKLDLFDKLSQEEQRYWIEFIYSADSEEIKAARIIKLLSDLCASP